MSKKTDNLINLLTPYGLDEDEVRVYLDILEQGVSSPLELHRRLGVSRTKVYRLLDSLEKKKLIVMRLHDRGQRYEASHPQKLQLMIDEKESKVERLKKNLPKLTQELEQVLTLTRSDSKVLYYEGIEGLKQVTYNSLKAKGELLTMEVADMNSFFEYEYAEKMRQKFIEREITIRTLTNQKEISAWTEVGTKMVKKYWEIRHLPADQLEIEFEILLYNDVYAMYRYQGEKIFCVEIYSQELAKMQRQIFWYMWQQAQPFEVLNKFGQARLPRA